MITIDIIKIKVLNLLVYLCTHSSLQLPKMLLNMLAFQQFKQWLQFNYADLDAFLRLLEFKNSTPFYNTPSKKIQVDTTY